mmetsp:Transcript_102500/g.306201  ORF Transcript_102500/g.306201 Transcript_102500/m.306201 type:complete len:305 (-) Transcript_102500:202-1116(-)
MWRASQACFSLTMSSCSSSNFASSICLAITAPVEEADASPTPTASTLCECASGTHGGTAAQSHRRWRKLPTPAEKLAQRSTDRSSAEGLEIETAAAGGTNEAAWSVLASDAFGAGAIAGVGGRRRPVEATLSLRRRSRRRIPCEKSRRCSLSSAAWRLATSFNRRSNFFNCSWRASLAVRSRMMEPLSRSTLSWPGTAETPAPRSWPSPVGTSQLAWRPAGAVADPGRRRLGTAALAGGAAVAPVLSGSWRAAAQVLSGSAGAALGLLGGWRPLPLPLAELANVCRTGEGAAAAVGEAPAPFAG